MENKGQFGYIFCLLTLFLCGTLLFLFGFFPASYSSIKSDNNVYFERPTDLNGELLTPPAKQYGGFILLLIDALRTDFVNSSYMPVTQSTACERLRLQAEIPTVTMPRLKTITTGTVSNFIDIVLNVGHTEQLEDSLLHRLARRGDVVSFAGDHTWMKLFPTEFKRHAENKDSFFVNDFYEGDKNITKVLGQELNKTDWTLLILHFLGLDHIGHVEGSESGKIKYKLKEMDEVVQSILKHKHFSNYLLMVTGDHGMANGGGHGGNTAEEIHVPLYLYSVNCSTSMKASKNFNQIDLAPTLAILLSIEIPKMSIGVLIPQMLQSLSLEDQLYAYYYNAMHLLNQARAKFGSREVKRSRYYDWFTNAKLLHKHFLVAKRTTGIISNVQFQNSKLDYLRVSRAISSHLSESLVKFDYGFIGIGLSLVVSTTLHSMLYILYMDRSDQMQLSHIKYSQTAASVVAAILLNIFCHYMDCLTALTFFQRIVLLVPISCVIYLTLDAAGAIAKLLLPDQRRLKISIPVPWRLLACFTLRLATIGSSSFIERENLTWYYLGSTLIILTTVETVHKFVSRANLELNDRVHYLLVPQTLWSHRKILVALSILTWLRNLNSALKYQSFWTIFALYIFWERLRKFNSIIENVFAAGACVLVYCFRGLSGSVQFFDVNNYARSHLTLSILFLFWCCVVAIVFFGYTNALTRSNTLCIASISQSKLLQLLQVNLTCSFLISALLHKPHNMVLLPALMIVLDESYRLCDVYCTSGRILSVRRVHIYKVILTIFIAKMFYFFQGNSNSLSTIDLNPGYIGQSSYNAVIVGIFVTLNTFGAEIHGFLYLLVHTLRAELNSPTLSQLHPPYAAEIHTLVIPLYSALTMLPVAVYLFLMVGFRYHLFIYSVFSPKVLYDCYSIAVFYLIFIITSLYFKMFK